jgi:hypothetical protein
MTPLRQTIEADLADTLQGEFASTDANGYGLVTLIDPEGITYPGIKGRVDYDCMRQETGSGGEPVIVKLLAVVLRISTLARVPLAGENWGILIPPRPDTFDVKMFKLGGTRAPEVMSTIGFIRLFPSAVAQS